MYKWKGKNREKRKRKKNRPLKKTRKMWKVHNRVNKITKERVKNISQEGKRKEAQEGRMYEKEKEEEQKKGQLRISQIVFEREGEEKSELEERKERGGSRQ